MPLLGSKGLNVRVPTMLDLSVSLPAAWEDNICDITGDSGMSHPSQSWLDIFWALVHRDLSQVPEGLHAFAVVPITGNRLASVAYCTEYSALGHKLLTRLPSTAAATLSAIGCLCVTDKRAHRGSPVASQKSLATALEAASRRTGCSLPDLVTPARLGTATFDEARELLGHSALWYAGSIGFNMPLWHILQQLPVFEDGSGGTSSPLPHGDIGLLPNADWEREMAALSHLLPWTAVKYHTASPVQRSLLIPSQMQTPALPDFLSSSLLPAINNSNTAIAAPLLEQALDELAAGSEQLGALSTIIVNGRLHAISKCVDGSSDLLRSLFSKHNSGEYTMLPEVYATPQRLAVLKRHGLAHEAVPDPAFFLVCAQCFSALSSGLGRDESRKVSRSLCQHAAQQYWCLSTQQLLEFCQGTDLGLQHLPERRAAFPIQCQCPSGLCLTSRQRRP